MYRIKKKCFGKKRGEEDAPFQWKKDIALVISTGLSPMFAVCFTRPSRQENLSALEKGEIWCGGKGELVGTYRYWKKKLTWPGVLPLGRANALKKKSADFLPGSNVSWQFTSVATSKICREMLPQLFCHLGAACPELSQYSPCLTWRSVNPLLSPLACLGVDTANNAVWWCLAMTSEASSTNTSATGSTCFLAAMCSDHWYPQFIK